MVSNSSLPLNKEASSPSDVYRVLVVDDSAVIRGLLARACESKPGIKVVASAGNGEIAVKTLQREAVDVIVLDIEMPIMDGLAAIPLLKAIDPAVQIIMASTLTQKNADISLKALSLGATDYIAKPTSSGELSAAGDFSRELAEKITVLGALARSRGVRRSTQTLAKQAPMAIVPKKFSIRTNPITRPDIIAIGSSTGGPQALFEVINSMGADLTQPIVITQHMPPSFTTILAEHIGRQCHVSCSEAKDGDVLQAGHYYIAPGDFHMLIIKKLEGPTVKLVKDPPENFCRPAVDPMLRSILEIYGKRILVVILTGMGQDGYKGCQAVCDAGGSVIAQDEASSVVWGMPGAVAMAGICNSVLPLKDIGALVKKSAQRAMP
jgi:two-component system chemotaxis response regulator CheB